MRRLRTRELVILLSTLWLVVVSGCQFEPETQFCEVDTDCKQGRVCTEGFCVFEVPDVLDGNAVVPCLEGQDRCNGECVDFLTDAANCGACNSACAEGHSCAAGFCACGQDTATTIGVANACGEGEVCCEDGCVNLAFDRQNCGTCGAACAEPYCVGGTCQCPGGTASCTTDAVCETNVIEDPAHCGDCEGDCAAVEASPDCVAGRCSCGGVACDSNKDCCAVGDQKSCLDTSASRFNCGDCGKRCAAGEECTDSNCSCNGGAACAAGEVCCSVGGCATSCACGTTPDCTDTCCSDQCVDTSSDRENCGACGNVCRDDQSCDSGTCVCASGTDCGNTCADLASDAENCGTCANACASGETCCGGSCVDTDTSKTDCGACASTCGGTCEGGECTCSGQPTNLSTDVENCGACGSVCADVFPNSDVTCNSGRCVFSGCLSDFANCDQNPTLNGCEVDTIGDALNCGTCGTSCQGGDCVSSVCECGGTASSDFQTDPANCGSCGNACSFANAARTCVAGFCQMGACAAGFANCDNIPNDGCEVNLGLNGDCGACGVTCPAGKVCANATCQLDNIVVQLTGGKAHTCARRADGVVFCWGEGSGGELGVGDTNDSDTPVRLTNTNIDGEVTFIDAGRSHTCAVVTNGDVYCWGANTTGQLGTGDKVTSNSPVKVQGLTLPAIQVACGSEFTCALMNDQTVHCWGVNDKGQMGEGTSANANTPQLSPVESNVTDAVDLCAGLDHVCALQADGGIECWGFNDKFQLGDDTATSREAPVAVTRIGPGGDLAGALDIDCFNKQTCARLPNGDVVCWGEPSELQLGGGVGTPGASGTKVINAVNASQVAVGEKHVCILVADQVKCWGHNDRGQTSAPTNADTNPPVTVAGLSNIMVIGNGWKHSCASDGNDVWCWGENGSGELGDNSTADKDEPVLAIWP